MVERNGAAVATMAMVIVQLIFSILNISYKLAANDGMPLHLVIAYRFLFGSVVSILLALLMERKNCSKFKLKIVFYGFICGLFGGSVGQYLSLKGIALTSATLASAMSNLGPAITFILAISLRLERLRLDTIEGKIKIFAAAVSISGAILLAVYEGPALNIGKTNINLLETTSTHPQANHNHSGHNLIYGTLLAFLNTVCFSFFLIIQSKAAEEYPFPLSLSAIMTTWAAIQGVVLALSMERNWNEWKLGWNIRLFTVFSMGILTSGLSFPLIAWCLRTRGPIFVSAFTPLCLVFTVVAEHLFLQQKPHLGTLLGCIIIGGGLYVLLWAKAQEAKKHEDKSTWQQNEDTSQLPS
ncbi:WAT1-related protein At1g68170-like [Andrographis paniculata]|uniref:WAT1-related protein At1g68170-like n=1 Tax=Andrographis paniculata TaxID=175694 RepID=UPI0021E74216|nr:WAT1-related protein At1g68170-like [Andrographis paniculata]